VLLKSNTCNSLGRGLGCYRGADNLRLLRRLRPELRCRSGLCKGRGLRLEGGLLWRRLEGGLLLLGYKLLLLLLGHKLLLLELLLWGRGSGSPLYRSPVIEDVVEGARDAGEEARLLLYAYEKNIYVAAVRIRKKYICCCCTHTKKIYVLLLYAYEKNIYVAAVRIRKKYMLLLYAYEKNICLI
jgi:hypothetical protein